MMSTFIIALILAGLTLAYLGYGYLAWVVPGALLILAGWFMEGNVPFLCELAGWVFVGAAFVFGIKPVRAALVSAHLMKIFKQALPSISETERTALEAGSVWFEGDLFSGKPDWHRLLNFRVKKLTPTEDAFLKGPVEDLCKLIDNDAVHKNNDLSPATWAFIKKHKFFGMIIPQKHGGLGFSAAAHAAVVTKISTRSVPAAVTVMVPNSLGPAELLLHYGTEAQKKHYLSRLARGEDIPCFALTEPHAGSDAANGRSEGIVCEKVIGGQKTVGILLNFNKRYITLSPVATVIGLAFRVQDPDNLLGDKEDIGITCALLPRKTQGLEIGRRHNPLSIPFMNGPLSGKDVFIPLDYVIGGKGGLGNGWQMLMEQLSTGRGISLPSLSVGAAELCVRATSAYSVVREQFGVSIGQFEGIQERLARIAGLAYSMRGVQRMAAGAVDAGQSPAVVSAIAKHYLTEGMRTVINDAMDIHAGSAICKGPRNIFAHAYTSIPIGITVEGANILTRSMIIFGQGALRCHPYVQAEVNAVQANDLCAFDAAFFGHINHITRNKLRAFFLGLTFGYLAKDVAQLPVGRMERRHYRSLNRLSAAFAHCADVALLSLGGSLKMREFISGRFADSLSHMFMASAALKQYKDAGGAGDKRDAALLDYVLTHHLYEAEGALYEAMRNLPMRWLGWGAILAAFPLGRFQQQSTDAQRRSVVGALLNKSSGLRDSLSDQLFLPDGNEPGLGALEAAYNKVLAVQPVRLKLYDARKAGNIQKAPLAQMAKEAYEKKLITKTELTAVLDAEIAQDALIQVDAFNARGEVEDVFSPLRTPSQRAAKKAAKKVGKRPPASNATPKKAPAKAAPKTVAKKKATRKPQSAGAAATPKPKGKPSAQPAKKS